jgi:signal transduction histidine kinase
MSMWFRPLSNRQYIRLLLQWRWLVLAIAIPVSIVIEFFEGSSLDLHVLDEVVLDGLIMPITTWAVLTFAARTSARQFERQEALEQRQRFMQSLAENRDYLDLAHFLVRFPGSLLPVEQVALFAFNRDEEQLALAAEWQSTGADEQPAPRGSAAVRDVLGLGCDYRVVLFHGREQVGLLRLTWGPGKTPAPAQLAFFNSLVPEMAMALALAIADAKEAERVYHEAQVHERRRITQELHDSLAQQVFYLHLGLDELADETGLLPTGEALQRKVASMRDVAADVYEQIRNNLSILRAWEQVNLSEAIGDMARVTGRTANLSVQVEVQGEPGWLSPHTCEHVYGIVREALNNVVKHAHARQVQVTMRWTAEHLSVSLSDDGCGFDPAQAPKAGHYGLTLMREAVDALQGALRIESAPGQGARLQISVPLQLPDPYLNLKRHRRQDLDSALNAI